MTQNLYEKFIYQQTYKHEKLNEIIKTYIEIISDHVQINGNVNTKNMNINIPQFNYNIKFDVQVTDILKITDSYISYISLINKKSYFLNKFLIIRPSTQNYDLTNIYNEVTSKNMKNTVQIKKELLEYINNFKICSFTEYTIEKYKKCIYEHKIDMYIINFINDIFNISIDMTLNTDKILNLILHYYLELIQYTKFNYILDSNLLSQEQILFISEKYPNVLKKDTSKQVLTNIFLDTIEIYEQLEIDGEPLRSYTLPVHKIDPKTTSLMYPVPMYWLYEKDRLRLPVFDE